MATKETIEGIEITVEEKLTALFKLQLVDSEIDKIKTLRGELPLEVQDLEDEIAGLEWREQNIANEIMEIEVDITNRKNAIKEALSNIKKYESKQSKVRNNREFDSLNKEIEFQRLEIELAEKRIKESTTKLDEKKRASDAADKVLKERKADLSHKHAELESIINETQKDEQELKNDSQKIERMIESRLLTAYKRIRSNTRNGLSVVVVKRDACGGCFNKIPPQRQMDIANRKKIIVCEYCGRILVDGNIHIIEETAE